jgi:hypothetical protein
MLEKSELAFFHNNWISDVKIEGIAYAVRFGDLGLAAGAKWLYTPFTEYNIYGERVSNGYYSEGVAILNASYNFLSDYNFSGLSVGLNLKGAFRIMPDFSDKEDDSVIGGSGLEQSAVMGMADVGLLTRFNLFKFYASRENNMSAAFVARNLGPPALDEPLPAVLNIALSYKPIRPLLFSFYLFCPFNVMEPEYSEAVYFAFGFSVNAASFLSMRTGVMIKAGSPRITVGSAVNLDKIALDVNYTLDLMTQLQPMNRVSLAVRFDLGDGGRRLKTGMAEDIYLKGIDAYSQGNFMVAKYYWEEALRLDPKFSPARQSLDMLYSREQLEQHIEELQKLPDH